MSAFYENHNKMCQFFAKSIQFFPKPSKIAGNSNGVALVKIELTWPKIGLICYDFEKKQILLKIMIFYRFHYNKVLIENLENFQGFLCRSQNFTPNYTHVCSYSILDRGFVMAKIINLLAGTCLKLSPVRS